MKKIVISCLLVLVAISLAWINYYSSTNFFTLEPESSLEEPRFAEISEENKVRAFDYAVTDVKNGKKDKDNADNSNLDEENSNFEFANFEQEEQEPVVDEEQIPESQQILGPPPAPIITEVEANPAGNDAGHEWVEMFYSEDIDFIGDYYLENSDGDRFNLTGSYAGFFTITIPTLWIENTNEKILLKYHDGSLLSETPLMNDSANNDKTWNRCISKWIMNYATPDYWNNCTLTCLGDLDYNSQIDGADLGTVLGYWGWLDNGYSDITGDARMNETDIDYILEHWGVCS